jgi:hypothetical protein
MAYKDTLQLFDEMVENGESEDAARIHAQQLGAMGTYIGDAINGMNSRLDKIDKDLTWMRIIGAAMTVTFFSNGFFMWLLS